MKLAVETTNCCASFLAVESSSEVEEGMLRLLQELKKVFALFV